MTQFTIDTDEDNEDLGQAVADAETDELLDIYRHLEGKTLFQYVADELLFREENHGYLSGDESEEVRDFLGLNR